MIYGIADRFVDSAISLPELRPARSSQVDWTVDVGQRASLTPPGPAYHHWTTRSGQRWATFYRCGHQRVWHFARTARFVVAADQRRVECQPIGRSAEAAWRPVLLNQVLPLLLGEDRLVLHASAVATARGAVVFAGSPGMGKSTVAAALAQRGCPLIADDFLVVDQHGRHPMALPSGLEPRLWPDSLEAILPGRRRRFPLVSQRSVKRRVAGELVRSTQPWPIAGVFVLTAAERIGVQPMSPGAAVPALTATTFVGRIDERAVVRDTFARVTSLVRRVPVRRLAVEHDFGQLSVLCETVFAALRSD